MCDVDGVDVRRVDLVIVCDLLKGPIEVAAAWTEEKRNNQFLRLLVYLGDRQVRVRDIYSAFTYGAATSSSCATSSKEQ